MFSIARRLYRDIFILSNFNFMTPFARNVIYGIFSHVQISQLSPNRKVGKFVLSPAHCRAIKNAGARFLTRLAPSHERCGPRDYA